MLVICDHFSAFPDEFLCSHVNIYAAQALRLHCLHTSISCVFEPSAAYPVSVLYRPCVQWLSLPQLSHLTASVRINTSSISTCSLTRLVHQTGWSLSCPV